MKKGLMLFILLVTSTMTYAKKVKFAVDMTGQTISANGVHVTGDFQVAAGYPADWESNTTTLSQEGTSDIYSIVVDLPAFAKYEYKFINGDQFYEAEFVPVESRVGYDFDDNRWIYVDSLANDTSFVGAILFAGNAPLNKLLVRYLVDMQNETVATSGVHLAESYQNWSSTATILYNFQGSVYEVIGYVDTGSVNYNFINGNSSAEYETVPSACTTDGTRLIDVTDHLVLSTVCFSSCTICSGAGVAENTNNFDLFPNPANEQVTIRTSDSGTINGVHFYDLSGNCVKQHNTDLSGNFVIATDDLEAGVYFIELLQTDGVAQTTKLVIE